LDHLFLVVDLGRRRQRYRPRRVDQFEHPVEQDLGVGLSAPAARPRTGRRWRVLELLFTLDLFRLDVVQVVAHDPPPPEKRSVSFTATGAGTIEATSPPKRAISRMSFDATNEWVVAEGRNTVWTPEMAR